MKVAVVGTGVIGSGWITRMLAHGNEVIATDPSEGAYERMLAQVKQNWPYAEQMGLADNASLENLTFTTDLKEAVKEVEHIQENVPEVEEIKDTVLREIDFYASPYATIGSSTSGIMPSELQKNLSHPERLVVAHPFHPVYILPLVEIVPGKQTSEENTIKAKQFYEGIGMDVLHVRHEIEGHIADRLMEALWREALHIVNDGIATTEEVDKAFTHAAGLRYAQYGPFMTFHLAGGEGGMRHMLKQFGPALKKPWTKLVAPELTEDLYDKVVTGSEASSQGYTMSELDQKRNEFLIKVKALAEQYWPEGSDILKKFESGGTLNVMNQYQYDTKVIQEWVDHNGHMNDAEYNRVLSDATDDWLAHLGLTLETIKTLHYTVFTLENHLTFLKEMKLDEDISVKVHLYDYDSKRLHVFMEMLNSEQALTSTYEVMLMGIDTENGRPSPFPDSIAHNIEAYYKKDEMTTRPKQLGHQIGITRK